MVLLGKALMGTPNAASQHLIPMQLQTALSLHSVLCLGKQLDADEQIGYVDEHTITQSQWIGTVPIGYADGWHQQLKATDALIDRKRVPIVGRISMNQLIVALPQKYPIGTRVTFIGQQGNKRIHIDEIAQKANQP